MTEVNQLFRVVSIWRDFNQNQLIETHNQLFETYQLKNLIDLYRLRLNQISKQNSEHKQSRGGFGVLGYLAQMTQPKDLHIRDSLLAYEILRTCKLVERAGYQT